MIKSKNYVTNQGLITGVEIRVTDKDTRIILRLNIKSKEAWYVSAPYKENIYDSQALKDSITGLCQTFETRFFTMLKGTAITAMYSVDCKDNSADPVINIERIGHSVASKNKWFKFFEPKGVP